MDSGHARAASMMNAAMRSRFVARIQKYEAKVRQGRVQPRDQNPNPNFPYGSHISLKKPNFLTEAISQNPNFLTEAISLKTLILFTINLLYPKLLKS